LCEVRDSDGVRAFSESRRTPVKRNAGSTHFGHPMRIPGAYARPRHHESRRRGEIAGFLLSLTFAGLAAVRDVYFGGLFQHVDPLLVGLTAFGLCSLVFLPLALVRDPGTNRACGRSL
jgi:hypothetical protein